MSIKTHRNFKDSVQFSFNHNEVRSNFLALSFFFVSVLSLQSIFAGYSSESCSEEHSNAVPGVWMTQSLLANALIGNQQTSPSISTTQLIILLNLLASIPRPLSTFPSLANFAICDGKPFGSYADPLNCRNAYVCQSTRSLVEAPDGYYFDVNTGTFKLGTCPPALVPTLSSLCAGKDPKGR